MAATTSLIKAVYRGRSLPSSVQVSPAAAHSVVNLPAGLRLEHLRYDTEEGPLGSVPLIVCSPAGDAGADAAASSSGACAPAAPGGRPQQPGQRCRCVVMLHATGSHKEAMLPLMAAYGQAGYITAAIDARYHGERSDTRPGVDARTSYQQALIRAWRGESAEHPFLLDNVFDLLALLDYLAGRPDVDANRIGMTGISLGGMHTLLAAAADARVAVAAPVIGTQHWAWGLAHDAWQGRASSVPLLFEAAAADLGAAVVTAQVAEAVCRKLLPGLLHDWDLPALLPCLAPRPLLIANGELDPRCPMAGVEQALGPARAAYAAAGAGSRLGLYIEPGVGHQQTAGMDAAVRAWFDAHL